MFDFLPLSTTTGSLILSTATTFTYVYRYGKRIAKKGNVIVFTEKKMISCCYWCRFFWHSLQQFKELFLWYRHFWTDLKKRKIPAHEILNDNWCMNWICSQKQPSFVKLPKGTHQLWNKISERTCPTQLSRTTNCMRSIWQIRKS